MDSLKSRLAALTVSGVLFCHFQNVNVSACGGGDDWGVSLGLNAGGRAVLAGPEFYFENEMRELAKNFSAKHKALTVRWEWREKPYYLPDGRQHGTIGYQAGTYDRQVLDAEHDDFARALPKDADAQAQLRAAREFITVSGTADTTPLPAEPAGEFADYHRGALLFKRGNVAAAGEEWKNLLARPAKERRWRSTWAAFMLGKIALGEKDYAAAAQFFQQTRKLTDSGFADSTGLAASSLGWEALANLRGKNFARAADLYMRQLATGDDSAVVSLRVTVHAAGDERCAADPLLRKIRTADLLARYDLAWREWGSKDTEDEQWLAAVERAGVKAGADGDADRLACLAYNTGKFDAARRWLKLADRDSVLSLWLRSKFAFRDGDTDAALTLMERAVKKIPAHPLSGETFYNYDNPYSYTYFRYPPTVQARASLGLLQVADGDFTPALKNFLAADFTSDAVYLAGQVLTVDELTALVRQYSADGKQHGGELLRGLLAQRLVLAGKLGEASRYFPEDWRVYFDRYTGALAVARDKKLPDRQRAAAFWKAARTARWYGWSLFNTWFSEGLRRERLDGFYFAVDYSGGSSERKKVPLTLPVTAGERERLKKSDTAPDKPLHYRYLAADLAWEAAKLLPADSQTTALVLNSAGRWLLTKPLDDDAAADRFYQEIERKCPRTELGRAAVKRHWFVSAEEPESL